MRWAQICSLRIFRTPAHTTIHSIISSGVWATQFFHFSRALSFSSSVHKQRNIPCPSQNGSRPFSFLLMLYLRVSYMSADFNSLHILCYRWAKMHRNTNAKLKCILIVAAPCSWSRFINDWICYWMVLSHSIQTNFRKLLDDCSWIVSSKYLYAFSFNIWFCRFSFLIS